MNTCQNSRTVLQFIAAGLVAVVAAQRSTAGDDVLQAPCFDPVLLRQLESLDALLIKYLHDHSCSKLLKNLGIETDENGLAVGRIHRKNLVFRSRYRTRNGISRIVLVYDPALHKWPGFQPQTIVIADSTYRLITWKEVGGSPMLQRAEVTVDETKSPTLILTSEHRHTIPNPKLGKYRYLLGNDQIKSAGIEWIYAREAERKLYEYYRKFLECRKSGHSAEDCEKLYGHLKPPTTSDKHDPKDDFPLE